MKLHTLAPRPRALGVLFILGTTSPAMAVAQQAAKPTTPPAVPASPAAGKGPQRDPHAPTAVGQLVESHRKSIYGKQYLTVPVTIHGRTRTFFVDLGSNASLIARELGDSIGLPHKNEQRVPWLSADSLYLGPSVVSDMTLIGVTQQELDGAEVPGVVGVLGIDVLSHYDLEFNLPARQVLLYERQPGDTMGQIPSWLPRGIKPSDCVPVQENPVTTPVGSGVEITFPVQANGVSLDGYYDFDSGSAPTYMNWAVAKLFGLTETSPGVHRATEDIRFGTIPPQPTWVADSVKLQIGGRPLARGPVYIVSQLTKDPDDPELSLGLDRFLDRPVFMSYQTGMMCVGDPAHP